MPRHVGQAIVLEHEHDLEDRCSAQVSGRANRFDQRFERQVLVLERSQGRVAGAGQKGAERRVTGEVGTERQHVDKVTDETLGLGPVPVGDRGADRKIGLAAVAVQQDLERSQQKHERCRALAPGESMEVGREPGR